MALRPASTSPITSPCSPRKSAWPKVRRRTARAEARGDSELTALVMAEAGARANGAQGWRQPLSVMQAAKAACLICGRVSVSGLSFATAAAMALVMP